jgi:hypothetical protein
VTTQFVDPAIRESYRASGGKLVCQFCGRAFRMKPGGFKGHVVFPYHNVIRRANRCEPLPDRCSGSDISLRVATDEEVDAEERASLIADTLKFSKAHSAAQLAAMSDRELERKWWEAVHPDGI